MINYGECRCCLVKGNHKDLSKEYYSNENRKVYSDIFIECFNLYLCSDSRLTSLICRACVKQLKDAHNFKKNVMKLENEMLKTLSGQDGNVAVFVGGVETDEVKQEIKEELVNLEDCGDDTDLPDDDAEEDTEEVYGEKDLLARFPRELVCPLPTRFQLENLCPGYAKRLEELKGKVVKARMIQDLLNKPRSPRRQRTYQKLKSANGLTHKHLENGTRSGFAYETPLSEKMAHVTNISTLLENSNLTAFTSKFKNGYPCFYCKKIFEKFDTLRDHQLGHTKENIQKMILKKYRSGRPDSLVVYVDVTNLKCTLCGVSLSSLNELKTHLSKDHKKALHCNYSDRVIPFLMAEKYLCQVCSFNFETFGAIARHMNTHYRNYVCEHCGSGFMSKHRLKLHMYNIHPAQGKFPCDICKKTYPTHRKFKLHNDMVHKMTKKLRCTKCSARFSYYYVLQKHRRDVHGETPVIYKCNVCEKEFKRRYRLSMHIKKEHLNQGDFNCEVCSFTCFSSSELKVHLAKRHEDKFAEKSMIAVSRNVAELNGDQCI